MYALVYFGIRDLNKRRTFCLAIKVKFLLLLELGFFEKLKLESSRFLEEDREGFNNVAGRRKNIVLNNL